MVLCGVAITGFTVTVTCDIVTRLLGRPWLWLQEVTMTFFIYGVFIGTAAATRRNDHLYLAAIAVPMVIGLGTWIWLAKLLIKALRDWRT